MEKINIRSDLKFTKNAIERGSIRFGFLGGSITAFEEYRSWTEPVIKDFMVSHPDVQIAVENVAIGSTSSDFGAFRTEEHLIDKDCDIVFVEYAVNDYSRAKDDRARTREGVIRKLLKSEKCDVVIVYTFSSEMFKEMQANTVPHSIADFEVIAEHYNLNSVWMGLNAWEKAKAGIVRWEDWLPDNTHPESRGGLLYAEPVIEFMKKILSTEVGVSAELKAPLMTDNWENVRRIPFDEMKWKAPWLLRRNASNMHPAMNTAPVNPYQYLETSAIDAILEVPFEGTGIVACQMYGKASADFKYKIDGGEWIMVEGEGGTAPWMGNGGFYKLVRLADGLPDGKHNLTIQSVHNLTNGNVGNRLEFYLFGEIK